MAKLWLGCRLLGLWQMELELFTKPISMFPGRSGSSVLTIPYYTWVRGGNEIQGENKERRKYKNKM